MILLPGILADRVGSDFDPLQEAQAEQRQPS